jgi:hypothetical protein
MTERLGHKQTAAMLALMALAREVSNPELRDIVGFALDGAERRELNDLHLVESRKCKPRNHFAHKLTEQGVKWCIEELGTGTPPPPRPRSSLVPALYVLLGGLDRYARREGLRLTDIFVSDIELDPAEIENRIRAAYRKLAASPRDWVGLADLRPMLGDVHGKDVDAVLKELSRTGRAHLVPESNRKALTDADHDAAIRVGGEDNHLIAIEAS